MHTTRRLLVGTLALALVGGLSAAVMAQDDEPVPADLVAATEANETANLDGFFIAQDLDAVMATYAEDAVFEDQTFGDYLEGHAFLRGMMGAVLTMTDWDATEVLDRFVSADGSRAVIVERWIGTNYRGVPFDLPIVLVHEYRDGKIAKESIYYAARDAYKQLTQSPSTE
jgi:steroid delta-isomerase-like uncharacterized protein